MGIANAGAQTNLEYWTQQLNIGLSGLTNGIGQTNGIVARVKAGNLRISSKEVIKALENKLVFAISKGITNFTDVVTDQVGHSSFFTTNPVVMAYPIFTPTIKTTYSAQAKLLVLQPLATNEQSSLVVIRDGAPPVDYYVGAYFQIAKVSFDGRSNNSVSQGRFDLVHDLLDATDYSIENVIFDDGGFSVSPPAGTYFNVQGFSREQQFSVISGGVVLANEVTKSAVMAVAGTGQVNTNGFTVLRGVIALTGGKHEIK